MNINFNCCTKPNLFKQNAGLTVFKGEKAPVEPVAKLKPNQPEKDTVEISKKDEDKCCCGGCCCKCCK